MESGNGLTFMTTYSANPPASSNAPRPGAAKTPVLAGRVLAYIALIACAALTLTPLIWLLAASLKTSDDLFHYTFFAPHPTLKNFTDLFQVGTPEAQKNVPFLRSLINSVFVTCSTVVVQLFLSSLAGFALAKYEFRGKKPLMLLMLATMLIPGQVLMSPLYELLYRLGLVDTYPGLIIPGAVSVFGIFLFRQSILQVPDELLQAARIDGCSEFRIYRDIVMPVSRPMIGAFCLISFMSAWNNFLWPQIILHSNFRYTLPLALNALISVYSQEYSIFLAGTLLTILPVIVLFLLLQKEFVAGLTAGAVKG